jgi:hypothetical protein
MQMNVRQSTGGYMTASSTLVVDGVAYTAITQGHIRPVSKLYTEDGHEFVHRKITGKLSSRPTQVIVASIHKSFCLEMMRQNTETKNT